jgi:hypothetical protein
MIREKLRFDDVDEPQPDGSIGYCYRGYNYRIIIGEQEFQVRTYDDEPDEATIISPATAQQMPEAQRLVQYVAAELGRSRVKFYHGPTGFFRAVNTQTLDFQ